MQQMFKKYTVILDEMKQEYINHLYPKQGS